MKTILVATDFSERSDRALRRATLLAKQSGARLSLVHVVDDDQPMRIVDSERTVARQLLREQTATLENVDGVACNARVVLADPFVGIIRAAEEDAPDLLVIGPHRRQALRDIFVGTTAERTIRSAPCPVLMANAPPVGQYRHVLFATDLSEEFRHVAELFTELDPAPQAYLSVLHVFEAHELRLAMSHTLGREMRKRILAEAQREAEGSLAKIARHLGTRSSEQLVRYNETSTANEILAAAKEHLSDLVVVAARRTGLVKLLLGSVAEEVLRHADRDVLAIPGRDQIHRSQAPTRTEA
ncbi:MAG TPA: universal stress protein [Aurantimonas coralicida]|uniref:Universal stress protein n=1 Tax=Aurantimonas coralicida TaxID=182270 RepID=A0A9C9NCZ8_9HYPH|nr:universal stress protein [Aurantimonas coralicida]HET98898.1 universal stress protein [Aurantimonas coralicida]